MKDKNERKRIAPYVAVGTLSGFLDRIRRISTPSEITSKSLEEVGVSKSDSPALMSTLRFLNLIENRGIPTEDFCSLQTSGEEFKRNLEKVVRSAYGELFSWLDPTVDDREHIRNYFARAYSPATAQKATALFLDLCDEAGIATQAGNMGRKQSTERKTPAVTQKDTLKVNQVNNKLPQFEVRIDSKDFASMQPEQIEAFFKGLSTVVKLQDQAEEKE